MIEIYNNGVLIKIKDKWDKQVSLFLNIWQSLRAKGECETCCSFQLNIGISFISQYDFIFSDCFYSPTKNSSCHKSFIFSLHLVSCIFQIQQVIRRMFPFGRGLCHAYWAPNFWVFYIILDKGLAFLLRKLGFNIQAPAASFTGGLVGDSSPFAILPQVTLSFLSFPYQYLCLRCKKNLRTTFSTYLFKMPISSRAPIHWIGWLPFRCFLCQSRPHVVWHLSLL